MYANYKRTVYVCIAKNKKIELKVGGILLLYKVTSQYIYYKTSIIVVIILLSWGTPQVVTTNSLGVVHELLLIVLRGLLSRCFAWVNLTLGSNFLLFSFITSSWVWNFLDVSLVLSFLFYFVLGSVCTKLPIPVRRNLPLLL